MRFRTLNEVRAEAKRRGLLVVQQRRRGQRPWYHVYAAHDGGRNLQQLAGDTTPERCMLEGLPELLAWAHLQWPAADNSQTVHASVDQVRGR